jgi:hypothetical protein
LRTSTTIGGRGVFRRPERASGNRLGSMIHLQAGRLHHTPIALVIQVLH